MIAFIQTNWHELPAEQATGLLESTPAIGLKQADIEERLWQFGPNQMTAQERLSEWVDASVIFGVVFTNAIIGYFLVGVEKQISNRMKKPIPLKGTSP